MSWRAFFLMLAVGVALVLMMVSINVLLFGKITPGGQ